MASHTVTGDLGLRPGKANNDSSSSRESSPDPAFGGKRKRSFSPGSVDGSPEPAEPFVNDETPQPEDRPLIRQAVAFGAATSSFSLPTSRIYTAKPPAPATGKTQFLPGQVVKKPRRKKKDDAPYKKQSGRFRLEAYNGTPMESLPGPVIQQGPGPYASAFRGYTDPRSTRSESPALTAPSTLASHSDRSASPAPTRGSANKRATANASTSKTPGQNRSRTQGRTSSHLPVQLPNAVSPPPLPMSPINDPADSRNYYRLDYDTGRPVQPPIPMDTSLDFPTMPAMRPAPMQGVMQGPGPMSSSFIDSPSPNLVPPPSPRPSQPRNMDPSSSSAVKPPPPSGRMVTILASDIRSGEADHLLIEVKVPIRPADNPADGYWADAKDLVEQWQGGPARIDGPARVYSHRGMYRQILLRVTSSNEDKYVSANVVVRRDRVVEVVIENLPDPGAPPRPQALPSSRQDVEMTPVSNTMPPVHRTPSTSTLSRLSQLPPPPASAGSGSNQHPALIPASHTSPPRENNPQHPGTFSPGPPLARSLTLASNPHAGSPPTVQPADDSVNVAATQPSLTDLHPEYRQENIAAVRRTNKGYESPGSEDDPNEVDQAITKLLSVLVLKEDRRKFMDFFSKASVETASNMVSRYIFVKELMDKYCGQPAPFKSTSAHLVEERHIVEALKIDDPDGRYGSNCKETLRLLRLYGKGGERLEDDEVLKLMEETEVPYNAKPAKRLLRLLREIDARWSEQHSSPE